MLFKFVKEDFVSGGVFVFFNVFFFGLGGFFGFVIGKVKISK